MKQHPVNGDWRRFETFSVRYVEAIIKWKNEVRGEICTFTTPIAVGMHEALRKMETQQNFNFKQFSISDSEYGSFMFAFCHLCSSKAN